MPDTTGRQPIYVERVDLPREGTMPRVPVVPPVERAEGREPASAVCPDCGGPTDTLLKVKDGFPPDDEGRRFCHACLKVIPAAPATGETTEFDLRCSECGEIADVRSGVQLGESHDCPGAGAFWLHHSSNGVWSILNVLARKPPPVSPPEGAETGSGYPSLDALANTFTAGDGMQYFTANHARALRSALARLSAQASELAHVSDYSERLESQQATLLAELAALRARVTTVEQQRDEAYRAIREEHARRAKRSGAIMCCCVVCEEPRAALTQTAAGTTE
jgi:hypothetical protein